MDIFIQFIIRPSALPLSLSLPPSQLVCLYPPSLLPPSSLPYCTNSLHKISHLLTQFTEIHFPPNPKSYTGVCMCIGLWGEDVDLSFSGWIYVSSPSVHNDAWHSRENIHSACQSNPFWARLLLSIQGGGTHTEMRVHMLWISACCRLRSKHRAEMKEREGSDSSPWLTGLIIRTEHYQPVHLYISLVLLYPYSCLISSNVRLVFSAILHPYPAEKTCICHAWMLEVCWCFQQAT